MAMNPPSLRDAQDPSFFRMEPFEALSLEVLAEKAPTGVVIGGAKRWDPSEEPSYPVVAAIKSRESSKRGFLLQRFGNILVRNLTDGSLSVRQAWSTEGKMPLYRPSDEEVAESGEKENGSREQGLETTTVIQDWVSVDAESARVPPSTLEISLLFGDHMSNSVQVRTGFSGIRGEDTVGWHAARLPLTAEERMDRRFDPDERCPPPPTPGIAWKRLPEGSSGSMRWPLSLAFRVEESSLAAGALRIPFHLVFAWLGSERALHLALQVPLERTTSHQGCRLGGVVLDLHPLFQEHPGDPEIVPARLQLVAICGNHREGPVAIDL